MTETQSHQRESATVHKSENTPYFRHNGVTLYLHEGIRYYVGLSDDRIHACQMEKGGAPKLSTYRLVEDLRDWHEREDVLRLFIATSANAALYRLMQQYEQISAASRSLVANVTHNNDGTITVPARYVRNLERTLPESEDAVGPLKLSSDH